MKLQDPSLFRQAALVGDNWIEADTNNAIEVNNQATGEIIGRVPKLGAAETRTAIEADRVAQKGWVGRTAKERC
ncbi:aldehyde dehydrogenase family protein, partial [Rhizobium ruizarguesonis]